MGTAGLRDYVAVAPASINHHHHHHHTQDPILENHQINGSNSSTALGIGVIPLLGAAPCLAPKNMKDPDNMLNNKFTGIQFWQNQNSAHYPKRPSSVPRSNNSSTVNLTQSGGQNDGESGSGSNTGSMCQDCGNQAKKDCSYRRCRTCCKSRSFECPTHVKSTWMPATRRRERQVKAAGAGATTAALSVSTVGPKKPRILITSQTAPTTHTSTSNATPPRSFDTSSTTQNAGFKETLPTQLRETAVFKCVRVTAVEEGEDEFAYETVVKIGGHVFKGLLYDQGVDGRDGFPNISELHLGGGGGRNEGSSSSPVHHPSDQVYEAANGCGLLGGSNYGNPIN